MVTDNNALLALDTRAKELRALVSTVLPHQVPSKAGLQSPEGQARLLHDLANIELQAIELGLRTLREYPSAPQELRDELTAITLEEGTHLKLCLDGLSALGFQWGHWPVHTQLNDSVSATDTLLERIFIVHCYLEGSGLDSGEILKRRLSSVRNPEVRSILERIVTDELKHVQFGVKWFRHLAQLEGRDPEKAMLEVIEKLSGEKRLPVRGAPPAVNVRHRAGFKDEEIERIARLKPYH